MYQLETRMKTGYVEIRLTIVDKGDIYLEVPYESYDPFKLLELLVKHGHEEDQ